MPRWIALLPVLAVPLAVWGVIHFGGVARDIAGPTAIAAADGRVFVAVDGTIHELDGDGNVVARHDGRAAGVDPWVSDLLLLSDGDLLVAGDTHGQLLRCTPGDAMRCVAAFATPGHPARDWRVPLKLARDGERVLVSLGNASRVLALEAASGVVTPIVTRELLHPNNLFMRDGALFIADTDHARIATCMPDAAGRCDPVDWATGFALAGDGMTRPTQIADDGAGGAWAIVVDRGMSNGTLVRVDADGREAQVVDIPERAHLASLTRHGDGLLVIDSGAFRVWQVDAQGNAATFGDADFHAALADLRAAQTRAADLGFLSLLAIFGLLLAAAGLLAVASILESRRARAAPDARALRPDAHGTRWLPPALDRRGTAGGRLVLLLLLLVLPGVLGLGLMPAVSGDRPSLAGLAAGLVLGTVIVVAVALAWYARRKPMDGVPVGLREQHLVVRLGEHLQEYRLDLVEWTHAALFLPDGTLVPLYDGDHPYYEPDALHAHLLPRLHPRRFIKGASFRRQRD